MSDAPARGVGMVMTSGAYLSAFLLVVGVAGSMLAGSADVTPPLAAIKGIDELRPSSLEAAGIVALILTPILQLICSAWLFYRKGERLFGSLALLVLFIVSGATLIGRAVV